MIENYVKEDTNTSILSNTLNIVNIQNNTNYTNKTIFSIRKAIQAYENLLISKPYANIHNNLGYLHYINKNYTKANLYYKNAINLDITSEIYSYNLGCSLEKLNLFEDAQKAFLDPNRLIYKDLDHSTNKEIRYYCLGKIGDKVCTVRFTYRSKIIRIFGAGYWRKEKKIYETTNKK